MATLGCGRRPRWEIECHWAFPWQVRAADLCHESQLRLSSVNIQGILQVYSACMKVVSMFSLPAHVARRTFLRNSGLSLGSMALTSLLAGQNQAAQDATGPHWNGILNPPHLEPRAKRIIWLYMAGGMTHIDTFDNKPKLTELNGKEMPESVTKGQQIAQLQGQKLNCFAPQHPFRQWGQSGQSIAEIWPMLGEKCADDLCIVRSLHTDCLLYTSPSPRD